MISFKTLWSLWKSFSNHLNVNGIPLPMVKDPKTGQGSVTVTLVVAASGGCIASVILMLSVFIAKINSWFILNDDTLESLQMAFDSSFELLLASLAAYLGRKWQSSRKNDIASASSSLDKPEQS